jgi:NADH-quinone oxidoreductase subunit E
MRVLSDGFYARADELMARYPTKRSAILMLLHDAQDEVGFVSEEIMAEIAELLEMNMADVAGVVTFYTMFKRTHPGEHLISLCTNPGCVFFGADETAERLRELIGPAQVTDEDLSWEEVECLAYCSAAPACQVNYHDVPHLTPERAERLVRALRDGRDLDEVISELKAEAKLPSPGDLHA